MSRHAEIDQVFHLARKQEGSVSQAWQIRRDQFLHRAILQFFKRGIVQPDVTTDIQYSQLFQRAEFVDVFVTNSRFGNV